MHDQPQCRVPSTGTTNTDADRPPAHSGASAWRTAGPLVALLLILALTRPSTGADTDCGPIDGLAPLLATGKVLLLGEIHGTDQAPEFAGTVVCHALAEGVAVTLALELPHDEQPTLQTFVAAAPAERAVAEVLTLPFWARPHQDGRSSDAMLRLIERVRDWRQAGHDVVLVSIDEPGQPAKRDAIMAQRVIDAANRSNASLVVTLTGNLHARTTPGSGWMGEQVVASLGRARVTSLNMAHAGGEAWICEASAGCGPLALRANQAAPFGHIELFEQPDDGGYDGRYAVGEIRASRPAAKRRLRSVEKIDRTDW